MTPGQVRKLEEFLGAGPLKEWQRALVERPHDDRIIAFRQHELTAAEFWLCRVLDRLMWAMEGYQVFESDEATAKAKMSEEREKVKGWLG